jgi:hypothetical protein
MITDVHRPRPLPYAATMAPLSKRAMSHAK